MKKPDATHIRMDVKGAPGSHLVKTHIELRGIRSMVTEVFDTDELTAASQVLRSTPIDAYSSLFESANEILEAAKEPTFLQIAELADKAKTAAPASRHVSIDDDAFSKVAADVAKRRGKLSKEAIASQFLATSDYLHRRIGDNDELIEAVYRFAEAWHWLHFEAEGEHDMILSSLNTSQGLSIGPEILRKRSAQRRNIISAIYKRHMDDPATPMATKKSIKAAAASLLPEINDSLPSDQKISGDRLIKELREIRKSVETT